MTGTGETTGTVEVVLPGDVDDRAAPSGGNTYDRQVCRALRAAGWRVREHPVPGAWPRPDAAAADGLARTMAGLPDGARVLLDGLVAAGVPDLLRPAFARLRAAVLVHLPLADETGLPPERAADLDAREGATLRAAGAVVATSAAAARRLVERHGLAADRVHVAPPGVAPAPAAPGTPAGTRLLCVAALIPRKGQDVLVEALAAVRDLDWGCELVGSADREPRHAARVRELVEGYGLGGRVRLAGPLTGGALDAAYAAADLLVLPSRAETYGMVVTEALARAVPVVATAVTGVAEALGDADGARPGLLVPPGDPGELAAALRRWLVDPALRADLRAAARRRRAALPGWQGTAERLAEVLTRLPRPAGVTR
jgi:glycosyltransferase involved in cell wall biosynthesis